MTFSEITSLIASLIAVITAIIAVRKAYWEGKKEEASAAEQYEGMAERTAKRLDEEIEKNSRMRADLRFLKEEVNDLRCQVKEYEEGIELLVRQLEANKIIPAWKPRKI